ncbi:NAD-dependent epimerase/dehydratase family protein [Massilia arenosa]|uniref:NAD-dependent epimerase/dehydratase family protein n=1 Tax=Zemynaea arenosa TaxID=2561931 RepID=A0A4Y9SCJ0_9BURK|nr:NmrA family NAD(P)-binding protein [Massilia arenosa]TFW19814.1 NAD-dependent epimerase/dehydratase family protein [Massilia arenosa]
MFVIMGASGHVGAEVMRALVQAEQHVIAVTHDPAHARAWEGTGVQTAIADLEQPESLRQVFRRGRRAFLLNPPAAVDGDTDARERHTAACIVEAVRDAGLEKVVIESTGGARPGERLGDLNVLWELEEGVRRLGVPAAINRAGFYMSNWDAQLPAIRETGKLVSLFPRGLKLPMAAPRDLGAAAAKRLLSPVTDTGIRYVEGPERYSADDVAAAFAAALQRDVQVEVVPRDGWVASFRSLGFSEPAAQSYARMTGTVMDDLDLPGDPLRGTVPLQDYIRSLVTRAP